MVRKPADPQAVKQEVAALGGLPIGALRERWKELFGNAPPSTLRREFLIKACAYQIQVSAFGGLSAAAKHRLRAIADAAHSGAALPKSPPPKIKAGTRLVRAWGGDVHTVTAVDGGFEYRDKRHRSLSAIARAITGTSWNGPLFFGLKATATPVAPAAGTPGRAPEPLADV